LPTHNRPRAGQRERKNMAGVKRVRKSQEPTNIREDASKRSFVLGRVLDEVATPLAESAVLAQRLLEGAGAKLTPEQRKLAEVIAETNTRSAQRLRDYVDLMLIEASELVLRPKACSVDDCIDQAVRQLRPAARARGINLVAETAGRPSPSIQADPARVMQVLANLIGNALKFTDQGQVTVSTEPYDRSVAVHVVDTGIGIPPAQQGKLFEDFFQDEVAKARDALGCGLGLTLSRRLVIRLGGDLWASSTVGAGSKFSFTVPRAPVAAAPSYLAPV
jgi:two-component system, sensor histidine kinase